MQTYFIGFLSGVISVIAIGIFIWTIKRRKTDTPGTLENDIDRNNINTGRGLDKLNEINREAAELNRQSENLNRRTADTAREAGDTIKDTKRTVSEIIAAAKRTKKPDD